MKILRTWISLFAVLALCAVTLTGCGGGGGSSSGGGNNSGPSAPAAPTGVNAVIGSTQVTLSWPAVSGAASYNIYWGTTTGVGTSKPNKVSVNATATPSGTVTGLTNGTTYFFAVTALSSTGLESAASTELSAIPLKSFVATGVMNSARVDHSAVLLNSGKVLVIGGLTTATATSSTASAELYDPTAGTFTATGSMTTARNFATFTLLGSGTNAKVLVAGGTDASGANFLDSAELYDPATGTFTATSNALTDARFDHTATLLPDGTVLLAGGVNSDGNTTNTAEIYDPTAGTFTLTGSMNVARKDHTATLLGNGKVLIVGGAGTAAAALSSAELYDPSSKTFTTLAAGMTTAREEQTATLLGNGTVLIAGGGDASGSTLKSAEIFDPAAGTFTATGSMTVFRDFYTASLLPDGTVLFVGGAGTDVDALNTTEIYNPATGVFTAAGSLITGREEHTATVLQNGKVLVTGGANASGTVLNSAELY